MAITKDEFKTNVGQIFSDGASLTNEAFDNLSENIVQLMGDGSKLEVEFEGVAKNRKDKFWESITARTEQTDDGQKLILNAGPWVGFLEGDALGYWPMPSELLTPNNTKNQPVTPLTIEHLKEGYNPNTVKNVVWQFGNNGSRQFLQVVWRAKNVSKMNKATDSDPDTLPVIYSSAIDQTMTGQVRFARTESRQQIFGPIADMFESVYTLTATQNDTLIRATYSTTTTFGTKPENFDKDSHVNVGGVIKIESVFVEYIYRDEQNKFKHEYFYLS